MAKVYTVGDFTGFPEVYEEAKKEEYCLYLAQFGEDITKCGVTRKERFEERMREQGADFGSIIAAFIGPARNLLRSLKVSKSKFDCLSARPNVERK